MSKEDELKEMADTIAPFFKDPIDKECPYCQAAEALYNAGYRLEQAVREKLLNSFLNKLRAGWSVNKGTEARRYWILDDKEYQNLEGGKHA